MGRRTTLWQRVKAFFRPPTETYDTRKARATGDTTTLPEQYNASTDPRRLKYWAVSGIAIEQAATVTTTAPATTRPAR